MKNKKLIYITLGIIGLIYLFKKTKKSNVPGSKMPSLNFNSQANKLANEQVKNLNFVPDMETMSDQYATDLKNCK